MAYLMLSCTMIRGKLDRNHVKLKGIEISYSEARVNN